MILHGIGVKEAFTNAKPNTVFASGSAPDSPEGLHMTGSGKTLYWVAFKGSNNDWCIYCGWENSEYSLVNYGDKVMGIDNVLHVIAATESMIKHYRF